MGLSVGECGKGRAGERDDVGLDPADEVVAEGEDVAKGEAELVTGLHLSFAPADAYDRVALLDLAVDHQPWVLLELRVDDLALEVGLADEVTEAGEVPGDVVGQQGEDSRFVAMPEALDVGINDVGVIAHAVLLSV